MAASTVSRPTENAAIGACPRDPRPRRHLLDLALLRMMALRNGDQHGARLFTAMIRRLAGVEVAW
jgi:hypothetical protein